MEEELRTKCRTGMRQIADDLEARGTLLEVTGMACMGIDYLIAMPLPNPVNVVTVGLAAVGIGQILYGMSIQSKAAYLRGEIERIFPKPREFPR